MMNNKYTQAVAVLAFAIIIMSPFNVSAQESSAQEKDTESVEKPSSVKWYSYLIHHLQFTKNIGYNMYGDNFVNSCINRLGYNDISYAMKGFKLSFEIKYNVFEHRHWNLYAGIGYALYSQNFIGDYVYFEDYGSGGTFIYTNDTAYIANVESKQPVDFGLEYKDWNSSFSSSYITIPIGLSYEADRVEYDFCVLPSVRVENSSLYRNISVESGENSVTMYESRDDSLGKYMNEIGCQLRFSCLYKGIIGGYVEVGTMSITKNLKHDIYPFSIGVQFQLTSKNMWNLY